MFNCLKDRNGEDMKEVEVFNEMEFLVERVRFSENMEGKRKKEILLLPAKMISTGHSKFYLIEVKSNFDHYAYHLAIFKTDFHLKFSNRILKL
jgi:hypothetical protein